MIQIKSKCLKLPLLCRQHSINNAFCFIITDIKVKEPTEESLTKKIRQYMDPKFMSVQEAAVQLVQIIESNPNSGMANFQTNTFSCC